jgi:glycine betaine/choline ABC-type transport system substrate-binding protein
MDRAKIVCCLTLMVSLTGLALLASCGRSSHIVVASKSFTEQLLIGEILAQQIERRLGVTVERKLSLGGTLLAHEALVKGDVDLYPEYTGTALTAILKHPPVADPAAALADVRAGYRQWRIEWLPPLGFNDTFAMIVRGETARSVNLKTISQAATARPWRLGVGYEFKQRPDGLAGLVKTYNLRLAGDPTDMDLGLLYAALNSGKVDMIAGNSTDGLASATDVVILEDDRRYFPPYQCSVVVRDDALTRYPQLRAALEELSGRLPDPVMRKLNYQVDGLHRSAVQVAGEFLQSY